VITNEKVALDRLRVRQNVFLVSTVFDNHDLMKLTRASISCTVFLRRFLPRDVYDSADYAVA